MILRAGIQFSSFVCFETFSFVLKFCCGDPILQKKMQALFEDVFEAIVEYRRAEIGIKAADQRIIEAETALAYVKSAKESKKRMSINGAAMQEMETQVSAAEARLKQTQDAYEDWAPSFDTATRKVLSKMRKVTDIRGIAVGKVEIAYSFKLYCTNNTLVKSEKNADIIYDPDITSILAMIADDEVAVASAVEEKAENVVEKEEAADGQQQEHENLVCKHATMWFSRQVYMFCFAQISHRCRLRRKQLWTKHQWATPMMMLNFLPIQKTMIWVCFRKEMRYRQMRAMKSLPS